MIHLGSKVSALLDGRLPATEEERCWAHVAVCPPCRDLVEREGWIKTRLAGLSCDPAGAPTSLKDSLARAAACGFPVAEIAHPVPHRRVARGAIAAGGSALGVAVLGVLALNGGTVAVRPPTADVASPVTSPTSGTPARPGRRAPQRAAATTAAWSPRGMVELVVTMAAPAPVGAPGHGARGGVVRVQDTMAR